MSKLFLKKLAGVNLPIICCTTFHTLLISLSTNALVNSRGRRSNQTWMHNRVRMVVGSLLIKNIGYHWQEGARWFWDTLVDADLASNTMGWQWVAGSGADAAPYFRVFNPIRQGERFDPEGKYVRQWVPEIDTYPHPIVDLKATRVEALDRFAKIKAAVK